MTNLYRCQNCSALWDEEDLLEEIPDLQMRVAPGEPMPAGECLYCKALCHLFEGEYADRCPKCQEGVGLTGFDASCRISVSPDGWGLSHGHLDTHEESFECERECGRIPSEWVFKQMSRKEALELMTAREGLRPFTVVGLYRDNLQRYATDVWARDPEHAEELAQEICAEESGGESCGGAHSNLLMIAGVLEGDVQMVDSGN